MAHVLISASNDNFLPLAKGLWLSLLERPVGEGISMAWVDLGGSEATRAWLDEFAPQVMIIDPPADIANHVTDPHALHYFRSLRVRPLLPRLVPWADTIVWIDSDIWIQRPDTIAAFVRGVAQAPDRAVITPILDIGYSALFQQAASYQNETVHAIWSTLYDEQVAEQLRYSPLLSNGLFAMRADNDLWARWDEEFGRLWARHAGRVEQKFLHIVEQTTLTYLLYTTGRYSLLDATHNFHANLGHIERDERDVVVIPGAAPRVVGAVHLSDIVSWNLGQRYLDEGLFFQHGEYLTEADRAALSSFDRR